MAGETKFCPECGKEVSVNAVVCPGCGVQLKSIGLGSGKNRIVAALLAIFLGGFGIQWFYLGKTLYGVLSLIFCWTGIPAIIAVVHFVLLLISSDEDFNAKYGTENK